MNQFLNALKAQIDPKMGKRAKPFKCLAHPIVLTEDYKQAPIQLQCRYLLNLTWEVVVWLDEPGSSIALERSRMEAWSELKRLIYGEIFADLHEIKYMIKYGETDDAIEHIDLALTKLGFSDIEMKREE